MFKLIKQEPVLFQALVQATIALLIGFDVFDITEQQFGLLMAFTAALLAFITRKAVTPNVNLSAEQNRSESSSKTSVSCEALVPPTKNS